MQKLDFQILKNDQVTAILSCQSFLRQTKIVITRQIFKMFAIGPCEANSKGPLVKKGRPGSMVQINQFSFIDL